jgi:AcrR family transcriptional regulator
LLQEKPFEELLVQDITDTATVNRATFYDHYTDKFTLFEAMVAADFHELLKERNIRFDGNPAEIEAMVLAVCDYLKEIHRSKKQCTNKGSFGPLLDSAVTRAIRIVVLDGVAKRGTRTTVSHEVLASTISWAIYGTTREWFYSKKRSTVDEIMPLVVRIVGPAFEGGVTNGHGAVFPLGRNRKQRHGSQSLELKERRENISDS